MTKHSSRFIPIGSFLVELVLNPNHSKEGLENTYTTSDDDSVQTRIGILLRENGKTIGSSLIGAVGGTTGLHDTSQILEDDKLVICCANSVFCLALPQLQLLWNTKVDSCTCFQIYKYLESYIVHGEMEVSRLDSRGKIMWQHAGADIFTTPTGNDHFKISESGIEVRDWNGDLYALGFNGALLSYKGK